MVQEGPDALAVRLTNPEMAALQEILTDDNEDLPYADLLPGYNEDQWPVATAVARLGLVARGLVSPDKDGQDQVDPAVMSIVAGSTLSDTTVAVTIDSGTGQPRMTDFHQYQDRVFLAHQPLSEGIHFFSLFADRETFNEAIAMSLDLHAPKKTPASPGGDIPAEVIDQGPLDDRSNGDLAVALADAGLAKSTAKRLAATLSEDLEWKSASCFETEDDEPREIGQVIFLQGDKDVWRVYADADDPDFVHIEALGATSARSAIESFTANV